MRITQLRRPVVAAAAAASASGLSRTSKTALAAATIWQLQEALAGLRTGGGGGGGGPVCHNAGLAVEGRRYASVKSQGAYRLRDSSTVPKKLGAKKTGGMCSILSCSRPMLLEA